MNANFINKTIEMTKTEAKTAGKIDSEKFVELQSYLSAYPTFEIKVVATPTRKGDFKGLDYAFMKQYISDCKRIDKKEILADFEALTTKKEGCDVASFGEVRKWFLETFPEIKNYRKNHRTKIEGILNNPRKETPNENNNVVSLVG